MNTQHNRPSILRVTVAGLIACFFAIAASAPLFAGMNTALDEPKELTESRNQYLQNLARMKDAFTRAGKSGDALAVQKEIDAVSPQARLLNRIANTTWAYTFKPNDPPTALTVTIHDDQTVSWSDRPSLRVAFIVLDERSIQVRDRYWKFSADLQSFTIHPSKDEPANRWGTRIGKVK